jgi:hypothetical protein
MFHAMYQFADPRKPDCEARHIFDRFGAELPSRIAQWIPVIAPR